MGKLRFAAISGGLFAILAAPALAQNLPPTTNSQTAQTDPNNSTAPAQVPPVSVVAPAFNLTLDQKLQTEGSAASGYVPQTFSTLGRLGDTPVLDTPFSVSVMPKDLIENTQASSVQPLLEMNPAIQIQQPIAEGLQLHALDRGFFLDTAEDGFHYTDFNFGPIPIEDKERVELLEGPSGFLNGLTVLGPGGLLNYVLKRPTATPYYSVTAGDYGGGNGYLHGDFGGPLDPAGRFGYRFNIVLQDGPTGIQYQNTARALFSGALDWHATNNLLIQFDASRQDFRTDGQQAAMDFGVFNSNFILAPPDASKNYSEPFGFERWERNDFGARLTWNINQALTFRMGYKYIWSREDDLFISDFPLNPNGTFEQLLSGGLDAETTVNSGYAVMDAKFNTGTVEHKLTFGFFGNGDLATNPSAGGVFGLPICNFNNMASCTQLARAALAASHDSPTGPTVRFENFTYLNGVVGDQVKFNDWLSGIAGLNYATIINQNYSPSGIPTTVINKNALTPSASLIVKPLPDVSIYATYIQGLENGGFAQPTFLGVPVTNPGAKPPTVDQEYEVGTKWKFHDLLATFALFDIDQPANAYVFNASGPSYTFLGGGTQENRGGEFSLMGKVTTNLTIWGGVTAFNSRITSQPSDPALVGKEPVGVSEFMGKLYAEYAIDALPGLVLSAGFQYYGPQQVNNENTLRIPGYVVGDVGARFETHLYGHDTMFRLNINNIANTNYWISPNFEGTPLTALFSAQVKF